MADPRRGVKPEYTDKKFVLILSGGLDSTVLAHYLRECMADVKALSIYYGQRHAKELDYAQAICRRLHIPHREVKLSELEFMLQGGSQTDRRIDVPEGHYAEESMKLTIVPNRNMLMLALAGAWAISSKSDYIAYAAHAGDHAIYPDCREEFVQALDTALSLADWHRVHIERPFIKMTKAEIVTLGAGLGVRFEDTWSCYKGLAVHCGKCGTCVERREAFMLADIYDPTEYAPS